MYTVKKHYVTFYVFSHITETNLNQHKVSIAVRCLNEMMSNHLNLEQEYTSLLYFCITELFCDSCLRWSFEVLLSPFDQIWPCY